MTVQKNKTRIGSKATINRKTKGRSTKRKRKWKNIERKINSRLLVLTTFFSGVILIIASYAWLSQTLNVQIKFFNLVVSSNNGLFISLDGIDYSDAVEISTNSIISDLTDTYPNHTNQWAAGGLWPVSTNGLKSTNNEKFEIYAGEVSRRKGKNQRRYLNTRILPENNPSPLNSFIAFDIFLKNVSGSPKNDNLYFNNDTTIDFAEGTTDEIKTSLRGVMNSMRFGVVRIGSVPTKTDVRVIQNLTCNNNCQMLIYEPNSVAHSTDAILKAGAYNVILTDGVYSPTYAVISEGDYLDHVNGQEGSGVPLDTNHFTLQKTITEANFGTPIFTLPNGVTKLRLYVWIEGQDMDSLETSESKGADLYLGIGFEKDLAGYE
jgi:hypothetical protein